jgi:DNA-binding beta-propeller fold protein YncE
VEAPEEQPPIRPEDMLVYWETIRGGVTGAISGVWARTRDAVAGTNYIQFVRPVALTVRDDYLYVVDAGLEQVLRYHRVTGQIETLLELRGVTAGEVSDIYVTPDYSFYLADTFGSRVLLFDPDGDLQRVFSSRLNLSHPVGVVEEENTGRVLVADGEFDHILVFNQAGGLETAIGGRGEEPGQFLNIQAFATGPNGLYIAARVGQKVQVLDPEGFYLYSLEQESVRFPMAIVSGEDMEVFVSDYLDNTIKLFERGRLVASIGGTGVGPGQFKRVTDLALADGFLYVADSLNGRVQVLRVATGPASVVAEEGAQ